MTLATAKRQSLALKGSKEDEEIQVVVKSPRSKILSSNKDAPESQEKKTVRKRQSPQKHSLADEKRQFDSLDWDNEPVVSTPRRQNKPLLKS